VRLHVGLPDEDCKVQSRGQAAATSSIPNSDSVSVAEEPPDKGRSNQASTWPMKHKKAMVVSIMVSSPFEYEIGIGTL
jgi:hypothetical protein